MILLAEYFSPLGLNLSKLISKAYIGNEKIKSFISMKLCAFNSNIFSLFNKFLFLFSSEEEACLSNEEFIFFFFYYITFFNVISPFTIN